MVTVEPITEAAQPHKTDGDIVKEFANKTVGSGEFHRIKHLWGTYYRINFHRIVDNNIMRSVFCSVNAGELVIPERQ